MKHILLLPFAMFLVILPFPGTVAVRLLLLVACFGIALWQWRQVPGARTAIPCKPALAAWIAVCLASLIYAVDFRYSLGEIKNELGYTLLAFFAFFVVARDRPTVLVLLRAMILGLLLIGGWATQDWLRHGFAWQERGLHGGIGIFATYVIAVVPALVWLLLEETTPFWQRLAACALAFAFFLAAITLQRVVWPVLAVQTVLMAALLARAGRLRVSRRQIIFATVAVALLATAGLIANQQRRYGSTEAPAAALAADSRLAFWPSVIATIGEHPAIGAGFGRDSMRKAYPQLVPDYNPMLLHPHNVFLTYGIGMGVPGMLALLALFACWGLFFWRAAMGAATLAGIAGLALLTGVVLRNQLNDFFVRDMSLWFWALTGLFARIAMTAKQGNDSDQQTST
jgi:O-antigen ligase